MQKLSCEGLIPLYKLDEFKSISIYEFKKTK